MSASMLQHRTRTTLQMLNSKPRQASLPSCTTSRAAQVLRLPASCKVASNRFRTAASGNATASAPHPQQQQQIDRWAFGDQHVHRQFASMESMDDPSVCDSWFADELSKHLVGLESKTKKATAHTTRLLCYKGDLDKYAGREGCDQLNFELAWSATPAADPARKVEGIAKVSLCNNTESRTDRLEIDAEIFDKHHAHLSPAESQAVLQAVQQLQTPIMFRLTEFLWDVEHHSRSSGEASAAASDSSE